jgi:hypothetical protein
MLACAAWLVTSSVAYADPPPPVLGQSTFERSSLLDRPHTVAEFEAGILALPTAPISPGNAGGATLLGKFGKGDATLETGLHFLYRGGREWGVGASAYFAPFPTTDTNYVSNTTISRTHSRSYLFLGPEFRYFPIRFRWFEVWLGATAGVIVIGDCPTLGGSVGAFEVGVTIGYRIPL